MKRLRLGPFKRQTEEQFDVVFRNGGSDVLTLDGLSENHATDISQNRQNGAFCSSFISILFSYERHFNWKGINEEIYTQAYNNNNNNNFISRE